MRARRSLLVASVVAVALALACAAAAVDGAAASDSARAATQARTKCHCFEWNFSLIQEGDRARAGHKDAVAAGALQPSGAEPGDADDEGAEGSEESSAKDKKACLCTDLDEIGNEWPSALSCPDTAGKQLLQLPFFGRMDNSQAWYGYPNCKVGFNSNRTQNTAKLECSRVADSELHKDTVACFQARTKLADLTAVIATPTVKANGKDWPWGVVCETKEPAQYIRLPFYRTASASGDAFYGFPDCQIGFSAGDQKQMFGQTKCEAFHKHFGSIELNPCFQPETPLKSVKPFEDSEPPALGPVTPKTPGWPAGLNCPSITLSKQVLILRFFFSTGSKVVYGQPRCHITFDRKTRRQLSGALDCQLPDERVPWILDDNPCFVQGLKIDGMMETSEADFLTLPSS